MSKQSKSHPFISIWFGNFFEPFYSDFEATRQGIADCTALGFNSINLDSKAWEDFFERYRGGKPSQCGGNDKCGRRDTRDVHAQR